MSSKFQPESELQPISNQEDLVGEWTCVWYLHGTRQFYVKFDIEFGVLEKKVEWGILYRHNMGTWIKW